MNYRLKSSSQETRKRSFRQKTLIIASAIVFVCFILVLSPMRQALFFIAEPIWHLEEKISQSFLFDYFRSKSSLIAEKDTLRQKLFLLGDLVKDNQVLKDDNDTLKLLLERRNERTETVLATILLKPPRLPYDSLIIDVGTEQGLKVGDRVIANGNVYLGTISEIWAQSAKVLLYSSPGQKVDVVISNNSLTAEAVGLGGGNFNLFLPQEVDVTEGDAITLPSIEHNIFGIIEKIIKNDRDSSQRVLFKTPINLSELRFVEVVVS